jgi:hypothetical protein
MKKTFLFCIFGFLASVLGHAQDYAQYKIKEHYDKLHQDFLYSKYQPYDLSLNNTQAVIADNICDGWSYILESEIQMYKVTHDKGYLVRFANEAINAMEKRGDQMGYSSDPVWAATGPIYQNGLIIWPMAHFWFLIKKEEPALQSFVVPQSDKIASNTFGENFTTLEDIAKWLHDKAEGTLDFITYNSTGQWRDNDVCYTRVMSPDNNENAISLNEQFCIANSLLYFGMTDPNDDYIIKARAISDNAIGTYRKRDCNTLFFHNENIEGDFLMNNTLIWHSNGWLKIDCGSEQYEDYEDVGHAVQVLTFVHSLYNTSSYHTINDFGLSEMIQLRNMFMQNVWINTVDIECPPSFHAGIDGDDVIESAHQYDGINNILAKWRVLSFMPFYLFDQYSNGYDLYDVDMAFYKCAVYDDDSSFLIYSGGSDLNGISDVVAAQWDKECVNLSLYKRDVVYDQDFNVKNILTVEPESNSQYNTANSFADPIIQTSTFTIEPNVTSNMVAGEEIILKPGFSALSGSNFSASIVPSICTDGHRIGNPENGSSNMTLQNNTTSSQNATATKSILPVFQNNLTIAPNPFNGTTSILFSLENKGNVTLKIINALGREVFSEIENVPTEAGNYNVSFDGNKIGTGIYFCVLQVNGEVMQTKKMVVL